MPDLRRMLRVLCGTVLALAAFPAAALDPHTALRQYGYQSWQTDTGLPQNTVHSIVQSRSGYLWIATEAGLVRFDGVQFSTSTRQTTPQLPADVIYHLMEDVSGTLWISTAGGLARWQGGVLHAFTEAEGLAAGEVWSTFQDSHGTVWALTAVGLARFDGQRFTSVVEVRSLTASSAMIESPDGALWLGTPDGLLRRAPGAASIFQSLSGSGGVSGEVQALAVDARGQIWAGLRGGLEVCAGTACRAVKLTTDGAATSVHAIRAGSQGEVWIGTDAGLFRESAESGVKSFTVRDGLPADRIDMLFRDREGVLWIGTSHGLARMLDGKIEALPGTGELLAAYEDREDNLWLGTESEGLGVLRNRKFTSWTSQDGLSDDYVRAVYQQKSQPQPDGQGKDGTVWVGTNAGGLNRFEGGRFTALTSAQGLSSNVVLALAAMPEGDLWAGTPDGLNRIRNRNGHISGGSAADVHIFTSADGLADDFVRSLYSDSHGALWIGTRRGLSRYAQGKFTTWGALDGLGSDLIGAMLEDRDGSLWIATFGGLTRFQNGHFQNFTQRDGLSGNVVTALHEDADGTLWIGTNDGGLTRLRSGKFTAISSRRTGLPERIFSLLEDGAGYLWLSSNDGIYRVSRDELDRFADGQTSTLAVNHYGVADGMKISECSSGGHPAGWRMADGSLWFATLRGIAVVDPAHMAVNRIPPKAAIEQISVDDAPAASLDTLNVPPGHTRYEFQYAGLSFVSPQKVRYRYQLQGFDRDWVDAGARRAAYYTNLPHGRYTFRVIASNNDGIWSEQPASAMLTIEPHFYQTLWFELLATLALIFLGYEAWRRRLRRVESEFQAVLRERTRIAREIHDTLAQGFVAVSVQLEIVSRLLQTSAESAKEHLERARLLVRSGLEDARTSIWELRSTTAAQEDLAARMKKMLHHLTASTSIHTRMQVGGAYRSLAPSVETELLCIAQEAVVNAVRHAAPSEIQIRLRFEEKGVEMQVSDNGSGFSADAPGAASGHFGLIGMRERADRIGGELNVHSKPGEGTQISLAVPIDNVK
jgi:ligand-binding sensor domain-containing protein/signal transduction histidine kinase